MNAPGTYTYGNYQSLPEVRSTLLVDKEGLFKNVWAISLSENDGQKLKDYLKKHPKPSQKLDFKTKPILTKVFDHPGISGFSTWGTSPSLELKPDLVAPGENVYSTGNDNSYFNDSGTSMVAPHARRSKCSFATINKRLSKSME
ncbi:S8 family serine peptidase [Streptococcus iniae]|nr:S8 family serine peptidase [Streptococcus iniae]WNZ96799.1 S8 family serine peptidase [Streptococcus iniae]